jgi:hypothetical protein
LAKVNPEFLSGQEHAEQKDYIMDRLAVAEED